jgi:hypothetical protein
MVMLAKQVYTHHDAVLAVRETFDAMIARRA